MIQVNELKGRIVAKGFTQQEVALAIGISPKTMSNKLRAGVFGTDEAEKLIDLLGIENPSAIFFAKKDT